ncbi:DUF4430 domain-containing protein [Sporolactobacillus laevolacticus]|uniref:Transcobalamin-like C-terminal domain-containing protein n=1 Tax=Sporolactobacillus laevolacticus DSM 442 TaxID=1395513 RepID=V6J7E0_9BACL|nr:DUF4430 domain-containing protein [Sporolactobacillus laevolacticus]EST12679.1 hypothetical protein P343_06065 [Sporolactobacillus laevolacticus DSM 442]
MKIAKLIVLIVSIGFIVFGLAFIAGGVQEKTVTTTHFKNQDNVVKADKTSSESNKIKSDSKSKVSEKKAQKNSDGGSSTVSTSSGSDSSSNPSSNSNTAEADANSTSEQQASTKSSDSSTNQSSVSNAADSSNQELISVEIKGYDNKYFSGNMSYKDGMTAFLALKALADSKNIALDYSGYGPTVYVKSIAGQSAGDKSAQSGWTYTVNGKTPNVSAGICKLHSGDTLVWTYQE